MDLEQIIHRLRAHAGLAEELPGCFVASELWDARGRRNPKLSDAFGDCLTILKELNTVLNGASPSTSDAQRDSLPRQLVYAVVEIVRLAHSSLRQVRDPANSNEIALGVFRLEVVWSAVLAGDIDDLDEHLTLEEVANS